MNLTLLAKDQISGKDKLNVIEKYGAKAAITDFAILLGGYVSDLTVNNSKELKDRTGHYWIKTWDSSNNPHIISHNNHCIWSKVSERKYGCRPAFPFTSISKVSSNVVINNGEILKVEYGEYPQYVVNRNEQCILENLYRSNLLNKTGKTYTTDSRRYYEYDKGFNPKAWGEYEYNGRKFVKVIASLDTYFCGIKLSNGENYKDKDAVWIEISPITWLVDTKKNIAVSERILVAGVQLNKEEIFCDDFAKTDMYNFLNNYLSKDIIPSKLNSFVNDNEIKHLKNKIKRIDLEISKLKKEKRRFKEQLTSQQKIKKLKRNN